MHKGKWLIVVVLPFLVCCQTQPGRDRRPYLIDENMANAARHMNAGRMEEAAQIYGAVLFAAPENEVAKENLHTAGRSERYLAEPTALGQNLVQYPATGSHGVRVLAYPLNRVLDALDVVTVEFGPQGGLYADIHATHALRFAIGGGGGVHLGWAHKRDLSLGSGHHTAFALGPFAAESAGSAQAGTGTAGNVQYSVSGLNLPTDFSYQRYRDYWGIGAEAVAGVVGARLEVHPVEIADLVAGVFYVDFLRDDIGSTRGLELTRGDLQAMEDLLRTLTPEERAMRLEGKPIEPVEREVFVPEGTEPADPNGT
jgi:hypothetical protein